MDSPPPITPENPPEISNPSPVSPAESSLPPDNFRKILRIFILIIIIPLVISSLLQIFFFINFFYQFKPVIPKSIPAITPSPSPIPSMQTYTNSNHNYIFEYPNTWYIAYENNYEIFITSTDPKYGGNFAGFRVKKFTVPEVMDLKSLRKYIINQYPYLDPKVYLSQTEIGNISGYKLKEDSAPENLSSTQYFFLNKNVIYQIETSEDLGFPERNEKSINAQILSTFKFTGQPTSNRELVKASDVYSADKLSKDDLEILSGVYWPKLISFKSGDTSREVYLVNCEVNATGFKLTGIPYQIPNVPNTAEITLQSLVKNHYGGFPDSTEISNYQKIIGVKYKNPDSGINGVILDPNGNLAINFYDSVHAYGGGSSRVGCLGYATYFTALQFTSVKSITMCINKYPDGTNTNCSMDFQP